jgi:hypothetical protein
MLMLFLPDFECNGDISPVKGWRVQSSVSDSGSIRESEHVLIVLSEQGGWPIPPFKPSHPKPLGRLTVNPLVEVKRLEIQPDQTDKRRNPEQDFN